MSNSAKTGRKADASGRRRNVTGEASREHILEVARRVLVRDGYHAFTTRRVAEASGISVGNLTYYFPNKSALVEAILEAVFERYELRYAELLAGGKRRSGDPAADLVAWFLRDAVTDATAGLFMELWVIAKHHRFGSEALTRFYDKGVRNVAQALAVHRPGLSERELQRIAYLMLTLSEGSTAVFARHGDRSVEHEEIIPLAIEVVQGLLAGHARGPGVAAIKPSEKRRRGGRRQGPNAKGRTSS